MRLCATDRLKFAIGVNQDAGLNHIDRMTVMRDRGLYDGPGPSIINRALESRRPRLFMRFQTAWAKKRSVGKPYGLVLVRSKDAGRQSLCITPCSAAIAGNLEYSEPGRR